MAVNDIARVYASSLVDVGKTKGTLLILEEEMKFISDLTKEDPDFSRYLNSPGFSKESKKDFIKKVLGGKISESTENLIYVMIDNGRQGSIQDVYLAMVDMIDEINNRIRVEVVSSEKLNDSEVAKIAKEISEKYKKEAIVNIILDSSLLGGIIIKIGDMVIDGSLSKDLKNIRNNILMSNVRSESAYED